MNENGFEIRTAPPPEKGTTDTVKVVETKMFRTESWLMPPGCQAIEGVSAQTNEYLDGGVRKHVVDWRVPADKVEAFWAEYNAGIRAIGAPPADETTPVADTAAPDGVEPVTTDTTDAGESRAEPEPVSEIDPS